MATAFHVCFEPAEKRRKFFDLLSVDRSGVYRQIVQESGEEEFGIPDFRPPIDLDRLWPVTTTIEEKRQFHGPTHLAYSMASSSVVHFVYGPPKLIHKIPGMKNAPKRRMELELHKLIPQG
ncbi:uncharacterized protein LOC132299139 isoform X1 [Cornus florida]|uniref:uncharacterized protein LOC132299139 isoform X1 n=1 Tax=Cornus florida TaxID=4283 RepID=UPI00289EA97C|nr:uncharacterized protein LOC132299139 isoform X1 [Cornus florida]XP_059651585.1 uncharacterized protein LOC132299139 isoform X1 [Cornus florida]